MTAEARATFWMNATFVEDSIFAVQRVFGHNKGRPLVLQNETLWTRRSGKGNVSQNDNH